MKDISPKSKAIKQKINLILKRLFWLVLTPLYLVNIVFGTIMILPWWVITGSFYYDSKPFKSVMNWLWKQYSSGVNNIKV